MIDFDNESIKATFADAGYSIYDASSANESNEMVLYKIPGDMSIGDAADTSPDAVLKVSATEAARMLGVGRSRVTAMIASKLLDGWRDGRNTWVTLDSVQARQANPRPAGRPKKAATA